MKIGRSGPREQGDPSWKAFANCRGTDTEAFFPEVGHSADMAKRVCGRCIVADDCLEWALVNDERFGVWGGLSERQRASLVRHRPVS